MGAKRLLIVDDDKAVAELIERVARRQGFDTLITDGSPDFAQTWSRFDPDIILLDILMPETDGIELLRTLADATCSAKVILISGGDPFLLECGQRLGEAYGLPSIERLHKPISLAQLRAALA